jgi:hypothetical protein
MDMDQLVALTCATRSEQTLAALASTTKVISEMERIRAVLVRRARTEGATWAQIAAALEVSKQAVHKKYGGRGLFGAQR